MSGFVLHPDALADLDEIWEFIAGDNLTAADGVLEEIYERLVLLSPFRKLATAAPILLHGRFVFSPSRIF